MTKLEKILKVVARPTAKMGLDPYSMGYQTGLRDARREISLILTKEDSLKDFFMTRLGMSVYDYCEVRFVLNNRTIKAPEWSELDKKYYLEDYKEINGTFYIFIEEKEERNDTTDR